MLKQISIDDAKTLIEQGNLTLFDMRDEGSFQAGHIQNAVRLTTGNLIKHVQSPQVDRSVLVYCYNGIGSEVVAQFLVELGINDVYSMIGGFEAWRVKYAVVSSDG